MLNASRTATATALSKTFETLGAAAGFTIPELLKYLAIAPIDASHGSDLFMRTLMVNVLLFVVVLGTVVLMLVCFHCTWDTLGRM